MDVTALLLHTQYAVPVGIVLVCAVLVFAFGFKKADQPPFAQLSGAAADLERKPQAKKRSKTKEKRAANGQVTTEKASPNKSASSKSESTIKKSNKSDESDSKPKDNNKVSANKKDKSQETKSGKENKVEHVKNKKNLKNLLQEKPVDYDEGDWEQAYSRKDKLKKKREEESPSKKSKKTKKGELITDNVNNKEQEKPEIKDKVAKETENKELKEKDNKEVILTPISNQEPEIEKEVENKDNVTTTKQSPKVEKVKKEEKKSGKSKKSKKTTDADNVPPAPLESVPTEEKKIETIIEKKIVNAVPNVDTAEFLEIDQEKNKTGVAVFDELGDVWKEAKPPKKSKKKSRKDN